MDIEIHLFPKTFTLLGINYEKMDFLIQENIKTCHKISIGLLIFIIELYIYEKESV